MDTIVLNPARDERKLILIEIWKLGDLNTGLIMIEINICSSTVSGRERFVSILLIKLGQLIN